MEDINEDPFTLITFWAIWSWTIDGNWDGSDDDDQADFYFHDYGRCKEIIRSILHLIFHFYVLSFTVYSILDIETVAQCYLCQKDLIIDFTNEILDFAEIERRTQNMKQIKPSLFKKSCNKKKRKWWLGIGEVFEKEVRDQRRKEEEKLTRWRHWCKIA